MAENVEGADADKGFHFFGERLDTDKEIGKRDERSASAFAVNGFPGAVGETFYEQNGDADGGKAEI